MRLTTEMRQGLKSPSIYGTLPGTTDENVIVLAHMDGWFDAALDNASGISVMLDTGRALREGAARRAAAQHRLRRHGRPPRRLARTRPTCATSAPI